MSAQTETKPAEQSQQVPVQNINEPQVIKQEAEKESAPKSAKEWDAFKLARKAERDRAMEVEKQAMKSKQEADALKAALDAVLNKPQSYQNNQREEEQEETEDVRIEKRVNQALAKREAELEKLRREQELTTYPERLSRDFKDFDQVCTSDNLDYLDYHYPEVAKAFAHMPQGYDKWAAIYGSVKRLIPNSDSKKDQAKADRNFQKPQSSSSPGMTQNGDTMAAFKLDEKKKAENWARMQKVMNKLS